MREKVESLILTFPNTTSAMEADSYCTKNKLPGRLIPVPREVTAGCGLAWKAKPEDKEVLLKALEDAGLAYEKSYVLML